MGGFEAIKAGYLRRYQSLTSYVPELIALRHGLRTAILLSLPSGRETAEHLPRIEDWCNRVGFSLLTLSGDVETKAFVSTRRLWLVDVDDQEQMGRLFGYPDCCVAEFIAAARRKDLRPGWTGDLPRRAPVRRPTGASRRSARPEVRELRLHPVINQLRDKLDDCKVLPFEMNPFLRTSPFHLYKHLPCSLACRQTLTQARALLAAIARDNRELHDHLVRFSRGPVLFTDICGAGIGFAGRRDRDGIRYSELFCETVPAHILHRSAHNRPEDLTLFDRLLGSLARGDRLVLRDDRLEVRSGRRRVDQFARPANLRWKLIDFR